MKNAVIFDVDGTLVDSVDLHAEAWHEAFHHFGFEIATAAIRTQIGKGGDKSPTKPSPSGIRRTMRKVRGKLVYKQLACCAVGYVKVLSVRQGVLLFIAIRRTCWRIMKRRRWLLAYQRFAKHLLLGSAGHSDHFSDLI